MSSRPACPTKGDPEKRRKGGREAGWGKKEGEGGERKEMKKGEKEKGRGQVHQPFLTPSPQQWLLLLASLY